MDLASVNLLCPKADLVDHSYRLVIGDCDVKVDSSATYHNGPDSESTSRGRPEVALGSSVQ